MAGLLGAATVTAAHADDPEYVVIDVGRTLTYETIQVHGINSHGQAVGEIRINNTPLDDILAFVWLPEDAYGLDSGLNILDDNFSGLVWARAFDINDDGQVIGGVKYDPGSGVECYPHVWDLSGSNSTTINAAPGRVAYDINDDANPLIVGGAYLGGGLECLSIPGFVYDLVADDLDFLDVTDTDKEPIAFAISNTDGMSNTRIAGASLPESAGPQCGGFNECQTEADGQYWDAPATAEVLKEIGLYSGDTGGVFGRAVNDDLLVVGYGNDTNDLTGGPENECRLKALVWDDSGPDDAPTILPRLDEAEQSPIDSNQAFGIRGTASSGPMEIVGGSLQFNRALLWSWTGSSWELTNLDEAACTAGITTLRKATCIGGNGWIGGHGNGLNNEGWVLVPYAEYRDEWCFADIANEQSACPDGVVNVFDLLTLLNNWDTDGPGADISEQGGGSADVDLFDLLDLLDAWNCHIGFDPQSLTPQEEAIAVGLTAQDWNDFEDLMLDGQVDEKTKSNWSCWMKNYLTECTTCPACPGEDPFN